MHSRFWTICAAGNVLLCFITTTVLYLYDNRSAEVQMSLTHRTASNWASGMQVWKAYYDGGDPISDIPAYAAFLPVGLDAVGCTDVGPAPVCMCLIEAHSMGVTECKQAAKDKMVQCFMKLRPVIGIEELERSLNPFALLDTLNIWGMMGSVLIWIRMYIPSATETMPYWVQIMLGFWAAFVHCSVMEPSVNSYVMCSILVLLMSGLCYSHCMDKEWWVSIYHVQYLFTVPNIVILQCVISQKRDLAYIAFSAVIGIVFALVTFAKTMLEQIRPESFELSCVNQCNRFTLLGIYVFLVYSTSGATGAFYFQSVTTATFITSFYLNLGVFGTSNIRRTYSMELFFRTVLTVSMLLELGMADM